MSWEAAFTCFAGPDGLASKKPPSRLLALLRVAVEVEKGTGNDQHLVRRSVTGYRFMVSHFASPDGGRYRQ
jgi:hypothetical protein